MTTPSIGVFGLGRFVQAYAAVRTPIDRPDSNDGGQPNHSQRIRTSRARNANQFYRKPCHDQPKCERSDPVDPWRRRKDLRPELDAKAKNLQRHEKNNNVPKQIEKASFDVSPDCHGFAYRHQNRPFGTERDKPSDAGDSWGYRGGNVTCFVP